MINIAIVDDELSSVERIKEYLGRYENETGKTFRIESFSDGDMIVSKYDHQFDIIFMDVEMKFMDGMSAAEEIRKIDSEVVIIFITNMAQYAIRGYAVQALDYLLKPVSYFAFSQCLNKALARKDNRETKTVVLDIKGGTARVDVKDIYYIETQGHTTICHVVNGEHQLNSTMRDVERLLSEMHFFRISRCYLINLAHVDNFRDDEVRIDKYTLPVSRTRKKEFFAALTAYWGEVIN
jgi:DNA-binding LytR/AlgR family response regulator